MSTFEGIVAALSPNYWWKLTDAAGSTTAAETEAANTGTVNGTVAFGQPSFPGEATTCAEFTAGFLSTANQIAFGSGTYSQFTYGAWINTTATNVGIFGAGTSQAGTPGSYDRVLWIDGSGNLCFGIYASGAYTITSPGVVNDGNWHFVAAVCGPSTMSLYVDGALVASGGTSTDTQGFTGWLRVGGSFASTTWTNGSSTWPQTFTGYMAHAVVWNKPLTATQINYLYTGVTNIGATLALSGGYETVMAATPGKTHWFPLTASPYTDKVGTVTLTVSGTAPSSTPGIVGSSSPTAAQMAASSYLYSTASNSIANANYAIELWYKAQAAVGGSLVSDDGGYFDLILDSSGRPSFTVYNSGWLTPLTAPTAPASGVWHHVVVSADANSQVTLYVDGVSVAGPTTMVKPQATYFAIGRGDCPSGWTYAPSGTAFAHVAVYNQAMPAATVETHYTVGAKGLPWTPTVGRPAVTHGTMHMRARGFTATRGGRGLAAGGRRVGRPLSPMLTRRLGIGR